MVKHLGYISVDIPHRVKNTLPVAIITDKELVNKSQETLRKTRVMPAYLLTPRAFAHLKLARAVASHFPGIAGVYASVIPPASDRVRTAGMYSRATEEIFIDLSQLERARQTVDTAIHELAHHTSGAEDLEERHSAHMARIAGFVVELTHNGRFDEMMRGITW